MGYFIKKGAFSALFYLMRPIANYSPDPVLANLQPKPEAVAAA
jgi:hypothetical protein